MIVSWFPKAYKLNDSIVLKRVCFAGNHWQIYRANDEQNVLIFDEFLAEYWFKKGVNQCYFRKTRLNADSYFYIESSDEHRLLPVCSTDSIYAIKTVPTFEDALSFAKSIANSRKLGFDESLENGIFIEKIALILPVPDDANKANDKIVLGSFLSGGIKLSAENNSTVRQLMIGISQEEYEEILKAAEIDPSEAKVNIRKKEETRVNGNKTVEKDKNKVFSLPGRIELENFFKDYIIDVVENSEAYSRMGIEFPSPFILQGPPGCGKTYAVEKLTEYLDWPCFYIDSSTIASSYIHETSKKISKIFDEAAEAAPSVIILDEMESFLSSRDSIYSHHIEEVGEFLRRIPDARHKKVLVVAMTNMIGTIDPAIRRKGRFDHIIELGLPSKVEIEMVINSYINNLPHSEIDVSKLSRMLENSSMADVDFVLRESARITAKEQLKEISQNTIEKVIKTLKSKSDSKNTPGFKVKKDNP